MKKRQSKVKDLISRPRVVIPLFLFAALMLLMVSGGPGTGAASAATAANFKLGVFLPNPGDLSSFENEIGRKTDIFLYYQSIGEDLDTADLAPIAQQGRTIQLAWEPWDPSAADLVNQPAYSLKNITAGNFDSDIHRWAQELRNFGYPVIFRPMCEMNGDWTSWSGTVNGNSPGDYVPAWRHIHDIFVQEGATNVKFDWSPNRDGDTATALNTFNTYYPGDAYVDYVGINGYNWGTTQNTSTWVSQWQSFGEVFGPSYSVFAAQTSKPIMVSETASAEAGGSKAQWITDMFSQLPVNYPRIASVTWFNINKETDWRVESSQTSLAAFKAAMAPSTSTAAQPVAGGPSYYFGWYDDASPGLQSWVLIGNPGTASQHAEVFIGGALAGAYDVGPGRRVTPTFPGVINGPVKVVSTSGGNLLVSERTIYNNSFSELPAASSESLATDYYLAWYDEQSSGMRSWIVVGNQGSQAASVNISIAGKVVGRYQVPAGGRITPDFPGVMNGPVEVTSTNGQPLNVSERVIFGAAFNEIGAKPAPSLATDYRFTWYDEQSSGMRSWIVVGNQGSQAASVNISIAGKVVGRYQVPAGGRITPDFPGVMNGPVEVTSTNGQPLMASQRSLYNGSFVEVNGAAPNDLAANQWFAWYDDVSAGMTTWVLVGNQGQAPVSVDIKIAGSDVGRYTIPAGGRVTPVFPGQLNGPVQVTAEQGSRLVVSQRTIYRGSFDEVLGRTSG